MTAQNLAIAVAVEGRKALASRVLASTAILLVIGVAAISGSTVVAAQSGNEQVAAKLGPIALQGGWPSVLAVALQVTAAAGLLAFGVGLGWIFGREFADGTITGLFGLPVARPTIALAKLIVYLMWTFAAAVVLTGTVAVAAAVATGELPAAADWSGLARLFGLSLMTATLPVPAAWAATIGRGLLPAIATVVGLMAVTQIVVVASPTGAWFPPAAPALWAMLPGAVSPPQLLLAATLPVGFGLLTLYAWQRLQLDR